jgi:hypothetical protein
MRRNIFKYRRYLGLAEKLENSRKSEKNVKIESLREFSSSFKARVFELSQ